jgi:hypothetical protein
MLPVLPDGSDTGVETLDRREGTETEPAVSQFVDEDLTTPLGTVELRERLDTLGRIRITMPHDDSGTPSDQRNAVLDRTDQGLDHPVAGLGLSRRYTSRGVRRHTTNQRRRLGRGQYRGRTTRKSRRLG